MEEKINIEVAIDDCKKIIKDLKCLEYDMNIFCDKYESQYIQGELVRGGIESDFTNKIKDEVDRLTKTEEFFECIVKYLEQTQELMNEMESKEWKERAELFK
jgi:hypothetical protein